MRTKHSTQLQVTILTRTTSISDLPRERYVMLGSSGILSCSTNSTCIAAQLSTMSGCISVPSDHSQKRVVGERKKTGNKNHKLEPRKKRQCARPPFQNSKERKSFVPMRKFTARAILRF